ncbi:MAG TPA: HAD-IA family hydrolase, partial [Acinetobacter pseudolwoffii]|nr:HAD-IA family hydrolase [Acinetobacter pseudolwoffii]
HPEVYFNVLQHFQVQAADCLIIEDSLIGVEAANNAGVDVIAVYDQYSVHEIDLIKAKVNYFAEDFAELLSLAQ